MCLIEGPHAQLTKSLISTPSGTSSPADLFASNSFLAKLSSDASAYYSSLVTHSRRKPLLDSARAMASDLGC
jgi:hypothetical protein